MDTLISSFGIDSWALGEFEWQNSVHPIDTLLTSHEHGIDLYDTAPVYGNGQSESVFGDLVNRDGHAESFFVSTKVGLESPDGKNYIPNGRPEFLKEQLQDSLDRLNLDRVDLVQLHAQDPDVPLMESLEALQECLNRGLARHTGYVLTGLEIDKFLEELPVEFLRVPFNMLDFFNYGDEFLKNLLKDYRVIAYDPLSGGLISQHYADINEEILDHEVREHHPKFTTNRVNYIRCLRKIQEYFLDQGLDEIHLESVGLAWLEENYDFESILVGVRSSNDIAHLQVAEELNLSQNDCRKLEEIIRDTVDASEAPYFIQPPPVLPRHSFERHIIDV